MAPTVRQFVSSRNPRQVENPACSQFVDDLVQYVVEYRELEDPPPLPFDGSHLGSEFGKCFLKFVRSRGSHHLEREILDLVVAECQASRQGRDAPDSVSSFVCARRNMLEVGHPAGCFAFLAVICKTCLEFYDAGRPEYVSLIKGYTKQLMINYPDCYGDILWLSCNTDRIPDFC